MDLFQVDETDESTEEVSNKKESSPIKVRKASEDSDPKEATPKVEDARENFDILDNLRTPFSNRPRALSGGSGDLSIFFRRSVVNAPMLRVSGSGGGSTEALTSDLSRPASAVEPGETSVTSRTAGELVEELNLYESKQQELEDMLKSLETQESEAEGC